MRRACLVFFLLPYAVLANAAEKHQCTFSPAKGAEVKFQIHIDKDNVIQKFQYDSFTHQGYTCLIHGSRQGEKYHDRNSEWTTKGNQTHVQTFFYEEKAAEVVFTRTGKKIEYELLSYEHPTICGVGGWVVSKFVIDLSTNSCVQLSKY
ncbi:MAG: hypothetical protein OEZ33_06860 [Gammaproteobacteria bacterium]|nr:hypothetical protein [Gammaproteobacteria bacterium]MDH5777912.1 hypothetical protein [Gammaproteobacteria bacterium]